MPDNYHKRHGVRQFHGCYSVGQDMLCGAWAARHNVELCCTGSAPPPPRTGQQAEVTDPCDAFGAPS